MAHIIQVYLSPQTIPVAPLIGSQCTNECIVQDFAGGSETQTLNLYGVMDDCKAKKYQSHAATLIEKCLIMKSILQKSKTKSNPRKTESLNSTLLPLLECQGSDAHCCHQVNT